MEAFHPQSAVGDGKYHRARTRNAAGRQRRGGGAEELLVPLQQTLDCSLPQRIRPISPESKLRRTTCLWEDGRVVCYSRR